MRILAAVAVLITGYVAMSPSGAAAQNANDPKKKLDPIINNNTVRVNPNPGPANRITPSGVRPMTPNTPAQTGGLRTKPVPSPASPNARINTQGRNVNPTGDPSIARGYDKNQQRNAPRPQPTARTTPAATPSWPGPSRPAGSFRPTVPSSSSSTTTSKSTTTTTKK